MVQGTSAAGRGDRRRTAAGFTLVELLVVIGIIAVLIAILLPTLNKAREAGHRVKCASNMHQIIMAALMRAQDNPKQPMLFPNPTGGNDSFGYLYPKYIKTTDLMICPSTQNYIRKDAFVSSRYSVYYPEGGKVLADITQLATNAGPYNGVSYEILAWYSYGKWLDGTFINGYAKGVRGHQTKIFPEDDYRYDKAETGEVAKVWGKLIHPHTTILIQDSDRDPSGDPASDLVCNNWPDRSNNHGTAGANLGFGDGHVAFVRRGPEWVRAWMDGFQGMAWKTDAAVMGQLPGLQISGSGSKGNPKVYSMTQ